MIKQNLIIFSIPMLSKILREFDGVTNFNIIDVTNVKELNNHKLENCLILTNESKYLGYNNEIKLKFPLRISKLLEKINIQFIRLKTKETSKISIGSYELNFNARLLKLSEKNIFLTEKETDLIIYLNKSKKPVRVDELQTEVWGYKDQIETHTVETHIHRLRKKILSELKKDNFILSNKNGYYLSK